MDLAKAFVRFSDRHRKAILAACATAAVAGALGTVRLYSDLRSDVSELLPDTTRSAVDLARITRRVGGFAQETLILHGADRLTLKVFADDLAAELAKAPRDLVRWVEYRVDDAQDFFRPRLLLFPQKGELEALRDTLRARIEWERARKAVKAPGDAPDVEAALQGIVRDRAETLGRFRDGYYLGEVPGRSPGEKMTILVMLVRMAGTPDDYAKVVRLDEVVRRAVNELRPQEYAPGLQVAYSGHVTSNILEHRALAQDLVLATILVVLAVALAVTIYNRTWKAVFAVGIPLLSGTFATFGLAELFVGSLNSNTAFLGSIVVGNGINVGLIFFARYLEERRRGRDPLPAMEIAVSGTWLATLTAALAAGVAYGSLLATDFRGFNQFGLIGGIGMALSWLFSYVMTPPLVLAWERRAPIPRAGQRPANPVFTLAVSHAIDRAPRVTALVAAAITAASAWSLTRLARDPFEYDFTKLRDRSALREGGPGWWDERVDALFGDHLTPTVILARDEHQAREIARAVDAHRRANPASTIGPVVSVASFVPEGQEEKLPVIAEIRALATTENLGFLSPDRRMAVQAFVPPEGLRPFGSADLPEALRRQLTETDGRIGTPVLLRPSGRIDVWNGRDVLRFADEVRSVPVPAGTPTASWLLLMADVLHSIARDGPRATLLSLAGVVALVFVAFGLGGRSARSVGDAAWVIASLAVGVLWFGGLAAALGLRLNMLNFIAMPITFGIGIDYATNILQRRRLEHARSIADVVRTTGGAVALCSFTTIVGYSSLLVARNQALVSFGILADVGEVACLAAALLALPAVLRWREVVQSGPVRPAREEGEPIAPGS